MENDRKAKLKKLKKKGLEKVSSGFDNSQTILEEDLVTKSEDHAHNSKSFMPGIGSIGPGGTIYGNNINNTSVMTNSEL
jgi:hypothetical protein